METVDVLPPDQMARWLRETAGHTRSRGNGQWTGNEVRVAKHVAFRLEQAATQLEEAHRIIWAVFNDGYCYCGPEGMTAEQEAVSDYTKRFPVSASGDA